MRIEKAFITGCDKETEWMLQWFVENYRKYNDIPLIFANFGVSEDMDKWVRKSGKFFGVMDISHKEEKGWFKKPYCMLNAPSINTFWIDTDCEILGNISNLFQYNQIEKLSMVEDKPWTKRRGETWYNSGVVGFKYKPQVLFRWYDAVKNSPTVGDQETLHVMLENDFTRSIFINPIPNEYNWLRVQLVNDMEDNTNKKIMHWTGFKGKQIIKEKIANG